MSPASQMQPGRTREGLLETQTHRHPGLPGQGGLGGVHTGPGTRAWCQGVRAEKHQSWCPPRLLLPRQQSSEAAPSILHGIMPWLGPLPELAFRKASLLPPHSHHRNRQGTGLSRTQKHGDLAPDHPLRET